MHVFRAGLLLSAVTAVGVTWAAWAGGDLVEIALVRGLLGMIAVAFLGSVGELVVLTAPGDLAALAERNATGPRAIGDRASALHTVASGARTDVDAVDRESIADGGEGLRAA